MIRAALPVALLLLLLASASWAAGPDEDLGYTVPTDGLFNMPADDTWSHDVIAWWWLIGMVFVSGAGFWVVQWIDDDARRVGVEPVKWNYAGLGLLGATLVAFFVLPPWLALPAAFAGVVALLWQYIPVRNAKVLHTRQLFTAEHLASLKRWLLAKVGVRQEAAEKRLAKIAKEHVPVTLFDQAGRTVSAAEVAFDPEDPVTEVKVIVGEAARRHAREVQLVPAKANLVATFVIDGVTHAGPFVDRAHGMAAMIAMGRVLVNPTSPEPAFRIQLPTLGRKRFTVRVSAHGEGEGMWMKLRLVGDDETARKFPALGMLPEQASSVRSALDTARGLVVVTGPEGMGSHTTIYAMLDTVDPFSRNVVTFERPILGKLDSIDQRPVAEARALAGMLGDILRKEVDFVMLSEIADARTAQTALTAASRDQVFLARMDVPDAASVPARLIELGASPAAVAAGLHTVVAERLVRRLCPSCRQKGEPPAAILQKVGVNPGSVECVYDESPAGCDTCGQTGFFGRSGVFEVWQPSVESRKLIAQGASVQDLHAAAVRDGMKSLQHSGLSLVFEGITSLRELARALKVN